MVGYDILGNQWVVLALFGSAALILYSALFYRELWKPRKRNREGQYETRYLSTWKAVPASIKLLVFLLLIFTVVYSTYGIIYPKSW